MKSLRSMLFLSTILVISVKTGLAQTAQITGRITDSSGAVIQGAAVRVMNVDNGTQRGTSSDVDGFYTVPLLQPGNYRITVEQPGFKTINRSGIKLTVDQEARIDLALEVGEVTEKVDVTEEAPLLESQTATVSTLVNNQQILEMPLNGRTFTSLLRLSPGAYTGSSGNLTSSPYAMRGDTNISVNGSSAQNNSYFVDGMVNRSLWLSTLVMVPTVDSINEIRVLTSNYSAEYGAAAGAVTIVQTKSGTNQFHGSAL